VRDTNGFRFIHGQRYRNQVTYIEKETAQTDSTLEQMWYPHENRNPIGLTKPRNSQECFTAYQTSL
jgi:hypothetical protein